MRLEFLYLAFVFISLLFVLSLGVLAARKEKLKNSGFVALCAVFLALYVIFGILTVFFIKSYIYKIIMLVFSLSPFLIGKLATYKYEKYYTFAQIIIVLLSTCFISGIWLL